MKILGDNVQNLYKEMEVNEDNMCFVFKNGGILMQMSLLCCSCCMIGMHDYEDHHVIQTLIH